MTTNRGNESDGARPNHNSLLVGPASQLRAPSSLLSGALPPSLLQEGESSAEGYSTTRSASLMNSNSSHPIVAMRPRRLWSIQDTALKRIPKGYPPMNPQCTTYVGDASPSVVAVRISECFRKRSIAVEYDDETVSVNLCTGISSRRSHVQYNAMHCALQGVDDLCFSWRTFRLFIVIS
jgi:hypothetical protein